MPTGHTAPHPSKARIAATMGKARILMEALPYIRSFRGKTIVVKYGGSTMDTPEVVESLAGDITLLSTVGINPVLVHGGGPEISRAMAAAGLEPRWVDGMRVTDAATIGIVGRVLADEINPRLVSILSRRGAATQGVRGNEVFTAFAKDPRLGYVGEIEKVRPKLIFDLVGAGVVPVVAPLARGRDGATYNLNADTAAGALAEALGAEKLVYLTDVEGLYRDLGDHGSLISRVTVSELRDLVATGAASAGMIPKLVSCMTAVESGVSRAHILDGRVQHALLLEIFTPEGIGTMVEP